MQCDNPGGRREILQPCFCPVPSPVRSFTEAKFSQTKGEFVASQPEPRSKGAQTVSAAQAKARILFKADNPNRMVCFSHLQCTGRP